VLDSIFAAGPGGGPNVIVVSGKDGTALFNFFAFDMRFTGGVTVAAGDVDGDGFADLITGADAGGGPNVIVYSGRTGAALRNFFAYDSRFTGGVHVAAGDFDGDGRADVVTGAGQGGGPDIGIFLSATGERRSFFALDLTVATGVSVAVGDLNGDGMPDLVIGAGPGSSPRVRVFSGHDLSGALVLADFLPYDPSFAGGVLVAVKDVTGTGVPGIVTMPASSPHQNVRVFRLAPGSPTPTELDAFFAFDPLLTGGVFLG